MISPRLKSVILRELDLEDYDMTEETVAEDIPGWDSLSHVRILTALEAEYRVRFSTWEVLGLKRVGDLQVLLEAKSR
jgi:acyl carrier protein